MKYVDEYRDPELAKRISAEIAKLTTSRSLKFMEVCGGHTHTITSTVLRCPAPPSTWCMGRLSCLRAAMGRIDDAIAIARMDGVISPPLRYDARASSKGSLLDAKADGLMCVSSIHRLTPSSLPVSILTARWSLRHRL